MVLVMTATDTTESQLLAELNANRDDEACWLVLADWWTERGDWRGEFLRWLRAWGCWGPNESYLKDGGYWFGGWFQSHPRKNQTWELPIEVKKGLRHCCDKATWLDILIDAASNYAKARDEGWQPEWPEGYE